MTERQITLDWLLSRYLDKPIEQLRPPVLTALRMGAYQLFFMDSVPDSAAVNTTVKLLKANECAYAMGLANAVLRKCAKEAAALAEESGAESKREALAKILPRDLGIQYSLPGWVAELWVSAYGSDTAEALMEASLGGCSAHKRGSEHNDNINLSAHSSAGDARGENYIRVNTVKTTRDNLIAALAEEGIASLPSSALPNAVILPKGTAPQKTKAFIRGLYHVQGLASQYCVTALAPQPGERVLDMCAAPGGKSFTAAQEIEEGTVTALELYGHRIELVRKGALRLGLPNITAYTADASKAMPEELGIFSAVLCDAPCSGLGTIGKKPDIRRKTRDSLDNLPEIQYTLLVNAARFVRLEGRLVYSTCTLNPAENEEVCKRFLADNPGFTADKTFLPQLTRHDPDSPFLTLFPHIHGCDGFFIARFTKG